MATELTPLLPVYNPDSQPQTTLATRLNQGLTSVLDTLRSSIQGEENVNSKGHTIHPRIAKTQDAECREMVYSSIADAEDWTRFKKAWLEETEQRHAEPENYTDLSNSAQTRNVTEPSNQTQGVEEQTEASQFEAIWGHTGTGDPVRTSVVVGIKNDSSCFFWFRGSIITVNEVPSVTSIRATVVIPDTPSPTFLHGQEYAGTNTNTVSFAAGSALYNASAAKRSDTAAALLNLRDTFKAHVSADFRRAIRDGLSFIPPVNEP